MGGGVEVGKTSELDVETSVVDDTDKAIKEETEL